MNRIFGLILLVAASLPALAQPGVAPVGDAYSLLAGEHTPVIYSGVGAVNGSTGSYATPWLPIGYSPQAASAANNNIARYNPEQFTLGLKIACIGQGDSACVTSARFETAYDTTLTTFWNADSSNEFIKAGNYKEVDYGSWRFESLADTSRAWLYPLRVMQGGYVRLVLGTTTSDSLSVAWTLTGEH